MRTSSSNSTVLLSNVSTEPATCLDVPLAELLVSLWRRRRSIYWATAAGAVVAVAVAFLIPSRYTSTVQLMPPTEQSISGSPLVAGLNGPVASLGASLAITGRSPGETVIGVLSSRTVQDDIIRQFHLRQVYHDKYFADARKDLGSYTSAEENKRSGIVTIAITDRDRNRARDIANAYIQEVNRQLNAISSSSARNERIFLEARLKSLKSELDDTAKSLSRFSSQNATLNPQSQGQATLQSAVTLQGQLISEQSELAQLRSQYADENVRVRAARARVQELQAQLLKIAGVDENGSSSTANRQLYPSLRKLPLLSYTYSDLALRLTMQQGVYELLNRQYELARVEEAKEIPSIRVLDPPNVPERKSSPRRALIIFSGTFLAFVVSCGWVIGEKVWELIEPSNSLKIVVRSIRDAFDRASSPGI